MKIKELEEKTKDLISTKITFADGKDLILYSTQKFTAIKIEVLKAMTSEQFKKSLLRNPRFDKFDLEDLPENYSDKF